MDGNADTNSVTSRSCTHTKENNKPSWWRVDLGSDDVPVSDIHIVNRFTPDGPASSINYKLSFGEYAIGEVSWGFFDLTWTKLSYNVYFYL